MRGWVADLVLGVRLAVGGGRSSWARLALTAVGVGLGVTVLLLASSIGPARDAKALRASASTMELGAPDPGRAGLKVRQLTIDWHGQRVLGAELAPTGDGAPKPAGVQRIPAPGELLVSPALADLLDSGDAAGLRAQFPERIVGIIGDDGLRRPKELLFYAGLAPNHLAGAVDVRGFGDHRTPPDIPPTYRLLLVAVTVALLVPLGIFVLVATRIGASARAQRLAAIRLAGAGRAQTGRIASGESLAGSVLGVFVGVALFFAARPLVRFVEVEQVGYFPTDLLPDPVLGGLVVLAVPVVAVLAALAALHGIDVGPLGLVRGAEPVARRVRWRVALVVGGVLVLLLPRSVTSEHGWQGFGGTGDNTLTAVGIALVLAGAAALLPWLLGLVAARWRPAGVAALLGVRQLRFDTAGARVLSGVVVVLAGGLALQALLASGAQVYGAIDQRIAEDGSTRGRVALYLDPHTEVRAVEESVGLVGGLGRVSEFREFYSADGGLGRLISTDCAELVDLVGVPDCRPGAVYRVRGGAAIQPGTAFRLVKSGDPTQRVDWVARAYTEVSRPGRNVDEHLSDGTLLVAAGADPAMDGVQPGKLIARGDPSAEFVDRLVAATARVDRAVRPYSPGISAQVALFDSLRGGVLGGSALVTLLAVVSLAVSAVDQVGERRRQVAVLVATGVPRRTLALAALWQNAVAMGIGVALAVPVGSGIAYLVVLALSRTQSAVNAFDHVDIGWPDVGLTVGAATVLVLVVTALTLPALRGAVRQDSLRSE
ncbi:ABC transporter permease [Solihabitans fulvus]|uniref:ABC transporter permease n=1 Tax=Solihabitans fulvus TaxID=1892852 RepID=UPI001661CA78|nr:ABC transporter permease [Solihabitans fulvus]